MNPRHLAIATLICAVVLCAAGVLAAGQGGGDSLTQKLGWRPAEPVPGFRTRAPLFARPTLEEVLANQPSQASAETEPRSRTVMPGAAYPARYRRMIRRYFELIRAPDAEHQGSP